MKTKQKREALTCLLPDYLASYLINNDSSGLEDNEIEEIDTYLSNQKIIIVGIKEDQNGNIEPSFCYRNDLNNLGSNCLNFIAYQNNF